MVNDLEVKNYSFSGKDIQEFFRCPYYFKNYRHLGIKEKDHIVKMTIMRTIAVSFKRQKFIALSSTQNIFNSLLDEFKGDYSGLSLRYVNNFTMVINEIHAILEAMLKEKGFKLAAYDYPIEKVFTKAVYHDVIDIVFYKEGELFPAFIVNSDDTIQLKHGSRYIATSTFKDIMLPYKCNGFISLEFRIKPVYTNLSFIPVTEEMLKLSKHRLLQMADLIESDFDLPNENSCYTCRAREICTAWSKL